MKVGVKIASMTQKHNFSTMIYTLGSHFCLFFLLFDSCKVKSIVLPDFSVKWYIFNRVISVKQQNLVKITRKSSCWL